jgi:hypothetical protein
VYLFQIAYPAILLNDMRLLKKSNDGIAVSGERLLIARRVTLAGS